MSEPGVRKHCVTFFASRNLEDRHERLQPQGRRSLGTGEQIRWRGRRARGERDRGVHQISKQRGGASRPPALDQSVEDCIREARADGEIPRRTPKAAKIAARLTAFLSLTLLLTACGGHKQARVKVPSPPSVARSRSEAPPAPPPLEPSAKTPQIPAGPAPEIGPPPLAPDARPVAAETGLASWYGAPYHNRRGSNGQVYDMNAMTAAHRTLPLGSIVRVTNVKTGHAAVVRITDRGPFVPGRIVDLSLAAAKKTDVWQPGIARVRVEVLQTPTLLETSGRWAVQIGAFDQENAARTLAGRLSQRYRTAKVLCFNSPVGDWWVRVRVRGDDKKRAEELAHETQTPQGSIFLVRLD
ncbi:MAG: septal ring lytic transglycosylase RlpA family lipoprotein [Acidobacteria bacterium]|nr:MAG: septal ring lytic transglycosylase RlpA family lipoprotein [Acidobacteriota bacterium]